MKHLIVIALILTALMICFPAGAQSETLNQVSISATIRTYVLSAPRPNAELVNTFEAGGEESAYGRDEAGSWLRILDGWVLAEVFNTEGEIGALPDTTHSFLGILKADRTIYEGPSTRWFGKIGRVGEGMPALVIGRNEDSAWLKLPVGWVEAADIETAGDVSLLPVTPSSVIITAKTRTFILKEPDLSAEFVDVFEAGDEALAIGQAGDWLQIGQGWVSAEAIEAIGDLAGLDYAGTGILITLKQRRPLRNSMIPGEPVQAQLQPGETLIAIGRNEAGTWLKTENGWISIGIRPFHASIIIFEGDIMSLPITDGASTTNNSNISSRPTPTPEPTTELDARAIHSLVSRHASDIRILDIETASGATTIEYDLKPWPFVANETIANEVAFKVICAIRNGQPIPNTLKFIGHTHFKSDVGRKFTGPSVEMHISASNANRIVCRGNDPSDINWRRIASRYKSYPIPRGASIDYD